MRAFLKRTAEQQAQKRLNLLRRTAQVTLQPHVFVQGLSEAPPRLTPALKFFFGAVGIILVIETAFSFVFKTAFSDLVHHAYPVVIGLAGGLTIYVILKLLLTRQASFQRTLETSFYVGGAALLVMIGVIFALLTADFGTNYQSVLASGCQHRTIMCLLSGNTQSEYGLMQDVATRETQGASYPLILLTMLVSFVYFTGILTFAFKRLMGIARWRTILASMLALILLTMPALLLLNAIYRLLYPAA